MQITTGRLGGRVIRVPDGPVRPTQDRIRQSLFSALGGRMDGWRVADLFAGSGSLGLEAWSRGAAFVLWVERDTRIYSHLLRTVRELCPESETDAVCLKTDALRTAWFRPGDPPFDLVLADPPYAEAPAAAETILSELLRQDRIRPDGWVVLEMASRDPAPESAGWRRVRDRVMGETRVVFYRPEGVAEPSD
ncbi:MAG: 16S rRNA (guanine(966)-N(2))-methyltransferase RsmD [Kiritimatiellia bacterium]|nr:16S rRNA (guanine(966)-N(2))-methyltransferase RsmD [Kiritimatiellia bacterium]